MKISFADESFVEGVFRGRFIGFIRAKQLGRIRIERASKCLPTRRHQMNILCESTARRYDFFIAS